MDLELQLALAPLAIPLAIKVGLPIASAIGSALFNQKRKAKQESVSTPSFDPAVAGLLPELAKAARDRITNPGARIQSLRVPARERINKQFSNVPQRLADQYLGFGGGQSGKFLRAARGTELARGSALSDLEGDFAGMELEQEGMGLQLALAALGLGRGQKSTGTQETPGNALGAGISSGLETGTFLYGLSKLMNQ